MALAYICVRCMSCESLQGQRQIERINGTNYCRPCAKRIRADTCDGCGHLTLDVHTVFGCLHEADGDFCPCPPPALSEPILAAPSGDREDA